MHHLHLVQHRAMSAVEPALPVKLIPLLDIKPVRVGTLFLPFQKVNACSVNNSAQNASSIFNPGESARCTKSFVSLTTCLLAHQAALDQPGRVRKSTLAHRLSRATFFPTLGSDDCRNKVDESAKHASQVFPVTSLRREYGVFTTSNHLRGKHSMMSLTNFL